jgi:hypothetical protein
MGTAAASGNRMFTRVIPIAVVAAFLLGFVPMWVVAHGRSSQLAASQREVQRLSLVDEISAAAFYAHRGEYENARRKASAFFTDLNVAIGNGQAISGTERGSLTPILNQRDNVITLLARSDPGSVDRLFGIEHQVRTVLNQ